LVNDGSGHKDTRAGADLLEYYNPKIVITQIGITDCAPRLLNRRKFSSKLLNVSPQFVKGPVYKYLKKHRERTVANADLSMEDFERNWVSYIERARESGTKILCIMISKPTRLVVSKSPEIGKAIELYNQILIRLANKYEHFILLEPYTQEEVDVLALD